MTLFIKLNILSSCQNLSIRAKKSLVNVNLIQVIGLDAQTGATSITLLDGKSALVSETQEQVLSLIEELNK